MFCIRICCSQMSIFFFFLLFCWWQWESYRAFASKTLQHLCTIINSDNNNTNCSEGRRIPVAHTSACNFSKGCWDLQCRIMSFFQQPLMLSSSVASVKHLCLLEKLFARRLELKCKAEDPLKSHYFSRMCKDDVGVISY